MMWTVFMKFSRMICRSLLPNMNILFLRIPVTSMFLGKTQPAHFGKVWPDSLAPGFSPWLYLQHKSPSYVTRIHPSRSFLCHDFCMFVWWFHTCELCCAPWEQNISNAGTATWQPCNSPWKPTSNKLQLCSVRICFLINKTTGFITHSLGFTHHGHKDRREANVVRAVISFLSRFISWLNLCLWSCLQWLTHSALSTRHPRMEIWWSMCISMELYHLMIHQS